MSSAGTNRKKLVIFALIICICLIIGSLLIARGYLTIEWVNAQIDTLEEVLNRPYGPALYVLGSIVFIVHQILGVVPVILAALAYGSAKAFLLSMVAVNIGILGTFLVARYFLRDYFAPKLARSRLNRFTKHLETNGILAMCFLRIVLWMFPPMNWLLGATNIKIRDYIIGSIIGLAPIIFAIQLVVKKLQSINSFWDLLQPETIAVVSAFIAFLLVVVWIRRRYFPTEESQFPETHTYGRNEGEIVMQRVDIDNDKGNSKTDPHRRMPEKRPDNRSLSIVLDHTKRQLGHGEDQSLMLHPLLAKNHRDRDHHQIQRDPEDQPV